VAGRIITAGIVIPLLLGALGGCGQSGALYFEEPAEDISPETTTTQQDQTRESDDDTE
jgi:predicted small lipoprotein YifL